MSILCRFVLHGLSEPFFLSISLCKRRTDAMTCQQRPKSTMYTNVEYKNEILLNNI